MGQPKKKLGLRFILKFYDAYMREKRMPMVAGALGYTAAHLHAKISQYPILYSVMEIADEHRKSNTMRGYVIRNLSPKSKKVWDEVIKAGNSLEAIRNVFSGKPAKIRQEIFAYSLLVHGWNVSLAMRAVGLDKKELDDWREDFAFAEMIDEVQFHKKNFFENQLIGLVAESHPQAVMFVNRTINADRGYTEKLSVEHSGAIGGTGSFQLEDLDLDLETRKKVLEAIKRRREAVGAGEKIVKALPSPGATFDAKLKKWEDGEYVEEKSEETG